VRSRWAEAARGEPLIALGMIMGSHGLHGLLRVKPYNTDSSTLLETPYVVVRSQRDQGTKVFEVASVRPADKGLFVQLAGVDAVEQSKLLHGSELCVPRSTLPALAPGEYYYADLAGLSAVLPSGETIGKVQRVIEYPAASVLSVELPNGVVEVPMREPYLVAVDIGAGHVTIDRLEDLDVQALRRKED
jgi:16S rRNA processing protein RimM